MTRDTILASARIASVAPATMETPLALNADCKDCCVISFLMDKNKSATEI